VTIVCPAGKSLTGFDVNSTLEKGVMGCGSSQRVCALSTRRSCTSG
jgi:hypothetical protein